MLLFLFSNSRFYFRSNDSILGSTISEDVRSGDRRTEYERVKHKVQPSHKSTPRPLNNCKYNLVTNQHPDLSTTVSSV